MKILIIQECGRHSSNLEFRECLCLNRAFYRLGIESIVWGLNFNNYKSNFDTLVSNCDVILVVENYTLEWIPDLSNIKKQKIFWSIDSHVNFNSHYNFCKFSKIDLILCSIFDDVRRFSDSGISSYWFPNAYPKDLIWPVEVSKTSEVGYCGSINSWRRPFIDDFRDKYTFKYDNSLGMDMVKAICSYKVHWNLNRLNDINYRTFETLGCGVPLVTNFTRGIDVLFEPGKHLLVYKTPSECFSCIDSLLANNRLRDSISTSGRKHALENHSYDNRAKQILEFVS